MRDLFLLLMIECYVPILQLVQMLNPKYLTAEGFALTSSVIMTLFYSCAGTQLILRNRQLWKLTNQLNVAQLSSNLGSASPKDLYMKSNSACTVMVINREKYNYTLYIVKIVETAMIMMTSSKYTSKLKHIIYYLKTDPAKLGSEMT